MDNFYEERAILREGIRYPFECHMQKASEKRQMVDAHRHDYIELLYCISGSAHIVISGNKHEFGVGDLGLINSREIHSIYTRSDEGVEYIVLKFDPNMLYSTSNTVFEAKYVFPFTLNQSTHQKIFTKQELDNTQIPELLKKTLMEYEQKRYGYELAIRNNIGILFLWILRNWYERGLDLNIGGRMDENTIKRLQFIFDYVEKNYMEDISAEMMAKECKMSYSYFSRFFKAELGQSFTNYLNYVRICEAEKLLIKGKMNVTEIALECGFTTTSYFIVQFKKHKNLSPKQFQLQFGDFVNKGIN